MCCRPKASFLIDDILQPSKPMERHDNNDAAVSWPARPTPVYVTSPLLVQQSRPHTYSHPQQKPGPSPLYVDDISDSRPCVSVPSSYLQGHFVDPFANAAYKGFGRCWTFLPGYSLSVLARPNHNKRKGGQMRFTAEQTATLERRFGRHKYLSPEERRHLAGQLRLTDRQVKTWFQNRRAKWRRARQATSTDTNEATSNQSDDNTNNDDLFSLQASPISVTS